MPDLHPGKTEKSQPADRLLVAVGGAGKSTARLLFESEELAARTDQRGEVIEATRVGSGRLRLVASTPGTTMSGPIKLTVTALTSTQSAPAGGTMRQEWLLRDIAVAGRTEVAALSVSVDDGRVWSLTAEAERDLGGDDPGSVEAGKTWGGRGRVSASVKVLVDRSASMAWAFQPDGALEALAEGLLALSGRALKDGAKSVTWASFGSPNERQSARIKPGSGSTAVDVVQSLRPELFSSGARPSLDVQAADGRPDVVVLVTDVLPRAEELEQPDAGSLAVVHVGAAGDDDYVPADERLQLAALEDAGIAVFGLAEQVAGGREQQANSVQHFFAERFSAFNAQPGGQDDDDADQ